MNEFYVYVATDNSDAIVYVGSGKGDRIKHVNSMASHNALLNKYVIENGALLVSKHTEGLTKQQAIDIEQGLIDLHKPIFNRNNAKDSSKSVPALLLRLVKLDNLLLSASERLLLFALLSYCNSKLECAPNTDELAARSGLSVTTIERTRKELSDSGWVKYSTGKGKGITNKYKITPQL